MQSSCAWRAYCDCAPSVTVNVVMVSGWETGGTAPPMAGVLLTAGVVSVSGGQRGTGDEGCKCCCEWKQDQRSDRAQKHGASIYLCICQLQHFLCSGLSQTLVTSTSNVWWTYQRCWIRESHGHILATIITITKYQCYVQILGRYNKRKIPSKLKSCYFSMTTAILPHTIL